MVSKPSRGHLFPLLLTLPLLAGACSETGLRSLGDLPTLREDLPRVSKDVPPPDLAPQIQITEPVLHAVYSTDFPLILRAQVADSEDPVEDLLVDWELLASGEILAGGLVPTSTGEVMAAAWLEEGGHALLATVTDRAGQTASDIVSFQVHDPEVTTDDPENTPPSAPGVSILPASPMTGDDLLCWVSIPSLDEDGDTISYSYQWLLDGLPTGDAVATVPSGDTATGDTWTCEVTPNDGQDDGAPGSASVSLLETAVCSVTITLDIDSSEVFSDAFEPASIPSVLYPAFYLQAHNNWQQAQVQVDNMSIEDLDTGSLLLSDSFDAAANWFLLKGSLGTISISGGVGHGTSDWNRFSYGNGGIAAAGHSYTTWDTYFYANTGRARLHFYESAPTSACSGCCTSAPCPPVWLESLFCSAGSSWAGCAIQPGVGFVHDGVPNMVSIPQSLLAVGWHTLGVEMEFSPACGP